jgi:hypothetical protein
LAEIRGTHSSSAWQSGLPQAIQGKETKDLADCGSVLSSSVSKTVNFFINCRCAMAAPAMPSLWHHFERSQHVPCRCRCNSVEDPSILLQDFCGPQCKHCSCARGCRKFVPCKPEAQCCSGTLAYGGQSGYSAWHAAVRGRCSRAPRLHFAVTRSQPADHLSLSPAGVHRSWLCG